MFVDRIGNKFKWVCLRQSKAFFLSSTVEMHTINKHNRDGTLQGNLILDKDNNIDQLKQLTKRGRNKRRIRKIK